MQNRVLDAANVLVNRKPFIDDPAIGRRSLDPWIGKTCEIPGRVDKSVHRIRLATGWSGTLWASHVFPGRMTIERIAWDVESHILRQGHRQIIFRHGDYATLLAMDNWDWATPIALARNTPVTQAIIDLPLRDRSIAANFLFQALCNFLLRFLNAHSIEKTRIDHEAFAVISNVCNDKCFRILTWWADYRRVAEPIFVHEVEVALVVRRTAENGTGSVVRSEEHTSELQSLRHI